MLWAADLLFPRDPARASARAGKAAIALAVIVALLFPSHRSAGTETGADRLLTAAALAACGLLLVARGSKWPVAAAAAFLPAAAALATGGAWLLVASAAVCAFTAGAMVPRPAGDAAPDMRPCEDPLRETIESVASALVLALLVREFGFEAFKIPTGSMEPTILGDGNWGSEKRRGDRLLAFKASFRDPERWEVTVFKYPLFRPTNYIKRCIGRPNEHILLSGGDVYADGVLQAKPDSVQEAMWQRVFPSSRREDPPRLDRSVRNAGPGWTAEESVLRADTAALAGDAPSRVDLDHRFEQDFRFSFDCEVAEWRQGGFLELVSSSTDGDVVLRVTDSGATLAAPRAEPVELAIRGSDLGGSFRIGLGVSDRIARVYVDGRMAAKVAYPDEERATTGSGTARIAMRGIRAALSGFEGSDDAQYRKRIEWQLGPDEFIMCGDNVDSSADSREWRTSVVELVTGERYDAPPTIRLDDDRQVSNHPEKGDVYEFHDRDGVVRRFPKEQVAHVFHGEARPFVKREDIVGPAFLVFWPVPPAGDFRPRIVR